MQTREYVYLDGSLLKVIFGTTFISSVDDVYLFIIYIFIFDSQLHGKFLWGPF